jgi:hypothetical protein
MSVESKYFVDVFDDIITNMILAYDPIVNPGPTQTGGLKPYGMYGHINQILKELTEKDKNDVLKYRKYPLIILLQDFKENHIDTTSYIVSPRILILEETKKAYATSDRYTNSYKTVLYTLYDLLLDEIADNPLVCQSIKSLIVHEKYDRVNWGTEQASINTGLILNDYLDGIEIIFDKLRVFRQFEPATLYANVE